MENMFMTQPLHIQQIRSLKRNSTYWQAQSDNLSDKITMWGGGYSPASIQYKRWGEELANLEWNYTKKSDQEGNGKDRRRTP